MNCLDHWIAEALETGRAEMMHSAILHCVPDKYKDDASGLKIFLNAKAQFHGLTLRLQRRGPTTYYLLDRETPQAQTDPAQPHAH